MSVLGGVGYILNIIPLANIVAPLLIGIAWYQMGSRTGQNLLRATGILMVLTFVTSVGFLVFFLGSIIGVIMSAPFALGGEDISSAVAAALFPQIMGYLAVFLAAAVALAALGLATVVLELLSHFRAAKVLNSVWFRRAAVLRIIMLILVLVFVAVVLVLAVSAPAVVTGAALLGGNSLLLLLPVIVLALLANIFSAIAFFTANIP
ncbi:MAG: hypothetical protein QXE96_05145 [Candidatus Caldarchaeum sp.]